MKTLPKARSREIVVHNLKDEVLVYDLTTDRAFCLNETLAKIFPACDGQTSFDELKTQNKLTDEIIYLALDELKKENLLETDADYRSPFAGMSRRQVIRQVGLVSMIALPVISSLVAPSAISAASTCGNLNTPCSGNGECCSGNCYETRFKGKQCCFSGTTQGEYPGLRVGCEFAGDCRRTAVSCCSGKVESRYKLNEFCYQQFSLPCGCYCVD